MMLHNSLSIIIHYIIILYIYNSKISTKLKNGNKFFHQKSTSRYGRLLARLVEGVVDLEQAGSHKVSVAQVPFAVLSADACSIG